MDEHRKSAYRHLLYWALLEIRGIEWITYRPLRLLNPIKLRRELRRVSRAGALADWLHNLAQLSIEEFRGFDEERFWRDYDSMAKRHGDPWNHRGVFNRQLEELGRPATPADRAV
jgi:hypothetical protein